jgi:hypothetical protein
VIPEAQHAIASGFYAARALGIRLLLPFVLPAVEFDDELRPSAGEIHDKGADKSLPSKMRAGQCNVMAKSLPEHTLGIGRLCAHLARKLSLPVNHGIGFNHISHRLWTPTPTPPRKGEGSRGVVEIKKPELKKART